MDIQLTVTRQSKVLSGVSFTYKSVNQELRDRRALECAVDYQALRDILSEAEWLSGQEQTLEVAKRAGTLDLECKAVIGRLNQAWLDMALVGVDGLTIAGEAVTAANIKLVPPAFYREVLAAIESESGLTGDEIKNSESPTISAGLAGGAISTTLAQPAS